MIAVMLLVGIAAFELVHLDCTGVDLTSPFRLLLECRASCGTYM